MKAYLLGSMVLAISWALLEAALASSGGGASFARALVETGGLAAVVAAGAALVGAAVHLVFRTALARRVCALEEQSRLAALLAFTLPGYASYGILKAAQVAFASARVHALVVALAAPVPCALGLAVFHATQPWAARCGARLREFPVAWRLLPLLWWGAWVLSLALLEPDVTRALEPTRFVGPATVVIGGLAVARLASVRVQNSRFGARVMYGGAGALVLAAGLRSMLPADPMLAADIAGRTLSSHWVQHLMAATLPAQATIKGTCHPGVPAATDQEVGRARPDAPDILLLTADAVRFDHTTVGGYHRSTTPRLARYAARGAVFERAYSPSTSTRWSIRALFTGLHPSQIEGPPSTKWGTSFSKKQRTLATMLKKSGYETHAVHATPHVFSKEHNALPGFDSITVSELVKLDTGKSSGTPAQVAKVRELLDAASDRGRPRFVWTHFMDAHPPYLFTTQEPDFGRYALDRYNRAIAYLDRQIEPLLEMAVDRSRKRPLYVVLTSDHGQSFKGPGNQALTTVFDGGIRVPFLVWGPDIKVSRTRQAVSLLDLLPTMLDLVGLAVPKAVCGRSLKPFLQTGKRPEERPIYVEEIPDKTRDFFNLAWIVGNQKLVVRPHSNARELYELDRDPAEKVNQYGARAREAQKMLAGLRAYYAAHGMDSRFYGLDK